MRVSKPLATHIDLVNQAYTILITVMNTYHALANHPVLATGDKGGEKMVFAQNRNTKVLPLSKIESLGE